MIAAGASGVKTGRVQRGTYLAGGNRQTSIHAGLRPLIVAIPASGVTKPSSIRSVVVFPAPLGPRNPVIEPGSTVKLRSSTAFTAPKRLLNPEATIRPGVYPAMYTTV
jgi:hypothetical protein